MRIIITAVYQRLFNFQEDAYDTWGIVNLDSERSCSSGKWLLCVSIRPRHHYSRARIRELDPRSNFSPFPRTRGAKTRKHLLYAKKNLCHKQESLTRDPMLSRVTTRQLIILPCKHVLDVASLERLSLKRFVEFHNSTSNETSKWSFN